ncbi:MAG: hypothetical protein CMJ77_21785 [Planctomycetaceae bacterium]|nr:hypothetical protein [Planctomycetaceae bacterium]
MFTAHLEVFAEHQSLQQRVRFVLESLPQQVQQDFLDDPRFSLAVDNYMPGVGWKLMVPPPGPGEDVTRCVVLRTNLGDCAEAFAFWVIAHEFAHAYLRNGGWGTITDVEEAADALAAHWGYPRPRGLSRNAMFPKKYNG